MELRNWRTIKLGNWRNGELENGEELKNCEELKNREERTEEL